jgi:hypothetical protein
MSGSALVAALAVGTPSAWAQETLSADGSARRPEPGPQCAANASARV